MAVLDIPKVVPRQLPSFESLRSYCEEIEGLMTMVKMMATSNSSWCSTVIAPMRIVEETREGICADVDLDHCCCCGRLVGGADGQQLWQQIEHEVEEGHPTRVVKLADNRNDG